MTLAKFLRLEKNMEVKEMEKLLGIPRRSHRYHKFEMGNTEALFDKRAEIAKILDTQMVLLQRPVVYNNGKVSLGFSRSTLDKELVSRPHVQSEKGHGANASSPR